MTEFNPTTGLASGSFGIGTYSAAANKPFPGIVLSEAMVLDLWGRWSDTQAIFDDWDRGFDALVDIAAKREGPRFEFALLHALSCVAHPNTLFARSNCRQHAAEMMTHDKFNQHSRQSGKRDEDFFQHNLAEVDRRSREGMPYFPTSFHSALAGANDDIPLPPIGEHPDWDWSWALSSARSAAT